MRGRWALGPLDAHEQGLHLLAGPCAGKQCQRFNCTASLQGRAAAGLQREGRKSTASKKRQRSGKNASQGSCAKPAGLSFSSPLGQSARRTPEAWSQSHPSSGPPTHWSRLLINSLSLDPLLPFCSRCSSLHLPPSWPLSHHRLSSSTSPPFALFHPLSHKALLLSVPPSASSTASRLFGPALSSPNPRFTKSAPVPSLPQPQRAQSPPASPPACLCVHLRLAPLRVFTLQPFSSTPVSTRLPLLRASCRSLSIPRRSDSSYHLHLAPAARHLTSDSKRSLLLIAPSAFAHRPVFDHLTTTIHNRSLRSLIS